MATRQFVQFRDHGNPAESLKQADRHYQDAVDALNELEAAITAAGRADMYKGWLPSIRPH